jgi:predicted CopG family antitoxin
MNKVDKKQCCNEQKLTTIAVSYQNYLILKRLGGAGDSFNDVLTELLKNLTKANNGVEMKDE